MAKVNVADLIGKKICIKGASNYYKVVSVEGEKVNTEFYMGTCSPKAISFSQQTFDNFLASGAWVVEGADEEPKAAAVEETVDVKMTDDVKATQPKDKAEEQKPKAAKPKTEPKPKTAKAKTEPKPKADDPKSNGGQYTYETYTTSKGKTGAKILGVSENSACYQQASAIHASGTFSKDANGEKHFFLCFGPRYAEVAKQVCEMLNAGKSVADCKAVVDKVTEQRAQQREEYKAKREEYKASQVDGGKTYTIKEVEQVLRKAFGALANAMNEDVAHFEPIIKASLPEAA